MHTEDAIFVNSLTEVALVLPYFRADGHVQIIAQKPDSMEWIRITGIATECKDKALRQKMYEETPVLQKHHASAAAKHFLMFKVTVENVEIK